MADVLTYEGEDFTITASFGEEAGIPAESKLEVREILPGTEEYENYYAQSLAALQEKQNTASISFARFFDIQILRKVVIKEPVIVSEAAFFETAETFDQVTEAAATADEAVPAGEAAADEIADGSAAEGELPAAENAGEAEAASPVVPEPVINYVERIDEMIERKETAVRDYLI